MEKTVSLNFVDLFCGAGGFSKGLEMAGHRCLLGVDQDKAAMKSFVENHEGARAFLGDITTLDKERLVELCGGQRVDLVVGGPPCQGFSTVGRGDPKDKRNFLFEEYLRVVKVLRPQFFLLENVTGLLAQKNAWALKSILNRFSRLGYGVNVQVMAAHQFGAPSRRRRTIIMGSLGGRLEFPEPTHSEKREKGKKLAVTVEQALKNIKARGGRLYNHDLAQAELKSDLESERLNCIPAGCGIRYREDEEKYLPEHLRLGVDWDNLQEGRFRQTKYYRLDPKRSAPTILTHRWTYYHPHECRFLTQREAARLQSFPNDFVFHGTLVSQWRQIGNAVPPRLAQRLGEHLSDAYLGRVAPKQKAKRPQKAVISKIHNERSRAFVY